MGNSVSVQEKVRYVTESSFSNRIFYLPRMPSLNTPSEHGVPPTACRYMQQPGAMMLYHFRSAFCLDHMNLRAS